MLKSQKSTFRLQNTACCFQPPMVDTDKNSSSVLSGLQAIPNVQKEMLW